MNVRHLKIALVGVGTVAVMLGWTWVNRRIEVSKSHHWSGPSIVGWVTTDAYSQRANESFKATFTKMGRPSRPTSQVRDVMLYYLSDKDVMRELTWSGIEVRTIKKQSMTYACDPPYNGYLYVISGEKRSNAPPVLHLGGDAIGIAAMEAYNEIFDSMPDARERFDLEREDTQTDKMVYSASNSKKFSPEPGENSRYVTLTPVPAFEKDYFFRGKWVGTYAVWKDSASMREAKIEKFRAD